MSFLDKILDGDVDEKAVSDMQQSLQSEMFTSQQTLTTLTTLSSTAESYIPQPNPTVITQSSYTVLTPGIKAEPHIYRPIVAANIKSEPSVTHGPILTMLQPVQHAQPVQVQHAQPVQVQHAQPVQVQHAQSVHSTPAVRVMPMPPAQPGHTTQTMLTTLGSIPTSSIVPTAVITPQRATTLPQVIAVSSSVMVPMAGGQFTVQAVSAPQPPQTIMVSATPHTTTQVGGIPVQPNMIPQPILAMSNKPLIVPIQPLQVKTQPIPIQPAIRHQAPVPQAKPEQRTAAILSSMSTRESVQKLKAFLTNLLSISNKQDAATGQTVKDLIGKVMTNNIDEETFLNELQVALKSPPQPHLLVFLKQSVPVLRTEMQSRQRNLTMMTKQNTPLQPVISHTPFPGLAPVQTSKMISMTGQMAVNQQFNSGTHYHRAPTFTAPQRTFADLKMYKKKYTLCKDDIEINDVPSMAGVNLTEEADKISTVDTVSQEQRNTQDVTMVPTESLSSKISRICEKHGIRECSMDVRQLLSHAVEARMRNIMERLVAINHHRLDLNKIEEEIIVTSNVQGQLKILEKIELEEGRRRAEKEKAQLMKEAKSRSKQSNVEAKAKAKQVAMEEEQLIRQREANETALAAIGSRKRPKQDFSDQGMVANPRFRNHRINLKDVIFLCENDHFLKKSPLLFQLHINPVK